MPRHVKRFRFKLLLLIFLLKPANKCLTALQINAKLSLSTKLATVTLKFVIIVVQSKGTVMLIRLS